MRIGILGGTFDPVHIGHLVLAQECWYQLDLDKVIFVPVFVPPHKDLQGEVSPADRLNMVRLALEGDDRFGISTYEIDKAGTSYSIETVKHVKKECAGDDEVFFLAGSDAGENLEEWKDIDAILDLTTFVIASRPGWEGRSRYEGRVKRIIIPGMDISSSAVRERIRQQRPIDHIVPARVVGYIRDKGLYRAEEL